MSPFEDHLLPSKFKRKQFPIKLSYTMTINKTQGQTIPNVDIYLPEPVFYHGQLYVALSRGVSRKSNGSWSTQIRCWPHWKENKKKYYLRRCFRYVTVLLYIFARMAWPWRNVQVFRRFGWKLIVKSLCANETKVPIRDQLWFQSCGRSGIWAYAFKFLNFLSLLGYVI
jgi:hypothetical protein